ncbi:hypothetical protein OOK36_46985 [Streptomyces sp. NBC_00365]|uniref:hypothetical protein n=1 Tax=Streptomyces sp. NBC_00365 TaxID=2975726 RepID=UPI0022520F13|nr:hypothetical protein [Streptomyces sp. NBC_00365]MCX5096201.1 hypothetical protein [Streptomyces sp. NBC_00365]
MRAAGSGRPPGGLDEELAQHRAAVPPRHARTRTKPVSPTTNSTQTSARADHWHAAAAGRGPLPCTCPPQWAKGFFGAGQVSRVLAALLPPFTRIGGVVESHQVNGQPGAIFRDPDGKVLNTWTLDILDGRIRTIRTVSNPDKLGHVGPVADAWAVLRARQRARQDSD